MTEEQLSNAHHLQVLINGLKEELDMLPKCVGFTIHASSIASYDPNGKTISLVTKLEVYRQILIDGLTNRIKELEKEFSEL